MLRIRQMRLAPYVVALLLFVMYVAPTAAFAKGRKKPAPPPAKTIVVFPFQIAATSPVETLGQDLPASIQTALSGSGAFRAFVVSEQLPSVRRAIQEGSLKSDDVKGGFGTEKEQIARAVKVAREMAADLLLVGSVDEVKVDTAKKKAEVSITVVLADVRTGEATKTVAVTGETPANTESTMESDLVAQAAGAAVAKLKSEIVPAGQQQPSTKPGSTPTGERKRTSGIRRLILPVLLGLAVGLVASGGSSNSGSSGVDNPPIRPY